MLITKANKKRMATKPTYVLFYSFNCKFSKTFINRLKSRQELFKLFNLVDIDKLPDIPDEVDEIPSVYDGKNIYKGTAAFKWLDEKAVEFLSPADDCLQYTFVNGEEESVFDKFSLLEQKNGSFGMGNATSPTGVEPTKSVSKNSSMESLMASRSMDLKNLNN